MTRSSDLDVPESPNGKEVFAPPSRAEWRTWLASNHGRKDGAWVVYRKRSSTLAGPSYDDLVEEALCFGWIDSTARRVDADRMMIWFSPRRPGGMWAASNKKRIERLASDGLMAEPGRAVIDRAKADGSWARSDDIEALIVPADLAAALEETPQARTGYDELSASARKQYLWWIASAKRPATRASRIAETVRRLS